MKKKLYLVANGKTRRIVGWSARQDERDGLLSELNRCGKQQYIPGVATLDEAITMGGNEVPFYEPEDLTLPEQFRTDFEDACNKLWRK